MNMYYIAESKKSFAESVSSLEHAVKSHGFGVLHIHDLGNTLRSKGVEFKEECKILEVCNPQQAAKVLATDMRLNMALPCRISVYTEDEITKIGVIKPEQMLSALSHDNVLKETAHEVEHKIIQMIDEAKE